MSHGKTVKCKAINNDKDDNNNDKLGVAKESKKEYNGLINNTFPTYKEGKGTQANELSTRWAHRADIEPGDRTAISFNDKWYLIEKFDDSDLGYQIVASLTEKQYKEYTEERSNGNRQEQSIQKGVSRFTSLDRQRNFSFRGESNNDIARSQQRAENQKVRGLGEEKPQSGQTSSNRGRDSESGSSSKQGELKFFLKDSKGNALTQEQVDFFKDSKVRDEYDNLQVVYHGTNNKFFTFEMSKNNKRNVWGEGFYFAKGKGLAYDYGENIIEAYLNIKNPYINVKSNLGTADYIKDKYFNDMWESSRQLGIDYITDKLEHSPIDLLQFIAEENNKQVADILNDYGYDGIIDGTEIVAFDSNQIKLTSNLNPTESVDIRYSLKPFAEQVDDVFSGADSTNTHLCVSENTPEILLQVGLADKPMLITATHTKTAIGINVSNKNIHSVDKTVFKQLPELIKNPAIIMESIKQGSLVIFVNAMDSYGNPIICVVLVDGKGNYNNIEIDANIVTSVYGKDTNPVRFIQKAVDENRILYWDKKMSQGLFNTPGLQLPDNIDKLDSNVIIRKTKANVNSFDENVRFSLKNGGGESGIRKERDNKN
ncbi:MAG: hypothetical protein RR207_05355 [Clostridia bacterium]